MTENFACSESQTMKNFRDLLKEELKDPEFKKEWDALESEFRHIKQQLETVGKITLQRKSRSYT